MSSVFISYRRDDSPDSVARIHGKLVARLRNRDVFYDHANLQLGQDFPELLRQKVTTAGVVLIIIGPKWVEQLHARQTATVDFVREEVRLALASPADVIPVLVGRATMPTGADLADFPDLQPLLLKNAQNVSPDPLFDVESDELLAHLERNGPADLVGSLLAGKYKVQRQIGEGGMGDVYLAEQSAPLKRLVAVKLIKPGMDSKEVLARFDAERQALAVMDHPNVCKVLDGGAAPNGRPFFVMEYVKGVPITQFCDDRKMTPVERLELFMVVCRGVQHAHQKGIIHRDIKPGNVLVEVIDGKPVPKVIDFGLAKALGQKLTDKSLVPTALGRWVGTLEYSSPEQAAGHYDIDSLSDVYSLGVLLYELLTGNPPFTREDLLKAGEVEMRRVIKEVEPTRPSRRLSSSRNLPHIAANRQQEPDKLKRTLTGDIDWIILKALDKTPDRRYATPTALADDLLRHLTDQSVSAGKPSALARWRKFYRRNRVQVLSGVIVLLALAGGIVATTSLYIEAARAKTFAEGETLAKERARIAESEQRQLAQENERRAQEGEKLAKERLDRLEQIVGPAIREATFHKMKGASDLIKKTIDPAFAKSITIDNIEGLQERNPDFYKPNKELDAMLRGLNLKDEDAIKAQLNPSSVPALVAMLKDSDPQVRMKALQLLRIMGPKAKEAIRDLMFVAKDKDVLIRGASLGALASMGKEALPALPVYRAALTDDELFGVVSAAAALGIGELGDAAKPAVPDLVAVIKKRNLAGTMGVLVALQKLGPIAGDAVPAVTDLLKTNTTPFIRVACLKFLHAAGPKAAEAMPQLRKILAGKDGVEQSWALSTLVQLGSKAEPAIPELIKILQGSDLALKSYSCQIFCNIPEKAGGALPELVKASEAKDIFDLTSEMLKAIEKSNSDFDPKKMTRPAHEQTKAGKVAGWATQALANLDPPDPKVALPLAKNLNSLDVSTRSWAAYGLGRLGDKALPQLADLKTARKIEADQGNRTVMDQAIAKIEGK